VGFSSGSETKSAFCLRSSRGAIIGFVNVAWDGAQHAFILDTTVDKDFRRRGIGIQLVKRAAAAAKKHGVDWLHVDFEPHLEDFYREMWFQTHNAGLINLKSDLSPNFTKT
jgi:GNAT superfamily N-acetyltransferase